MPLSPPRFLWCPRRARALLIPSLLLILPPIADGEPVTLRFWAVTGVYQELEMYKLLAADFEKQTGIRVRVTPLGWGNFATKYLTAMAAGVPPDVGVTNLGGPVEYGRVGGVLDLRESFPEEIEEFEAEFFPKLLPGFTFRGKLFGLPASLTTMAVFYRADIFARLGIKPPETWSELSEAIRALEAAGYHYGFGWPRGDAWALNLYSMPFGVPYLGYDQDRKARVFWDNPVFQEALFQGLSWWSLHDLGDKTLQGARQIALFKLDDPKTAIPLLIDLSFIYNAIPISAPEINGKWDILPWPKADQGEEFNIVGGTAYVIFRESEHPQEAFKWLRFLNSVPAQEFMVLHSLSRGEDSTFVVSPIRALWEPDAEGFWQRPELAESARIKEVMAQVVDSFALLEPVLGGSEVGRLLDASLDRLVASAMTALNRSANRVGMSRWEFIQSIARGEREPDAREVESALREAIRSEAQAVTGPANSILEREARAYDRNYGDILDRLDELDASWDVLSVLEVLVAGLLAILTAVVLLVPACRRNLVSYLFIAPPVVCVLLFVVVPATAALYLSLTEYMPVLPLATARWVGPEHYRSILSGELFFASLFRTVLYALGMLPAQIAIALALAVLLNNPVSGQRWWRFVYFSPMVSSVVSVSLIFVALYQGAHYGWANALLLKLGFIRDIVVFLDNEKTFLGCVIVLAIWHGLSFNIIVFLAGLQQIPVNLYEAAEVDGAGWFRRFLHITLPGLRPQMVFLVVVGCIWAFQVFEPIYMLGGGAGEAGTKFGPNDAGQALVPLIYQTGFEDFRMGQAAAYAYLLFAILFVLTLLQVRTLRRAGV